jgi:hypothetical protein
VAMTLDDGAARPGGGAEMNDVEAGPAAQAVGR